MHVKKYIDTRYSYEVVNDARKQCPLHYHSSYELYYLISGTTKYFIDGKIYFIESGNFVFIPPNVYHSTDSENCMNNERILISFGKISENKCLQRILADFSDKNVISLSPQNIPQITAILEKIEKEYNSSVDENTDFLIDIYASELLVFLYRHQQTYNPKLSETEKIIYNVSKYINKNYAENITLKSLSKQFNLSSSYLSRQFKGTTGFGINEYLNKIRLMNSETLIKNSHFSITEIAEKCGFNDSNYFSTLFKRLKGMTPTEYKKLNRPR